jgi:hypothetical protein
VFVLDMFDHPGERQGRHQDQEQKPAQCRLHTADPAPLS